jgi:aspartate/methionine/tyrosine aminotransferase
MPLCNDSFYIFKKSIGMKIVPSLLETWLLKYQNAPYNLGESGVTNLSVGELMSLSGCSPEDLYQLSLENNDTYGSLGVRKAIASFYDGVASESILVTSGTTEAILIYFHVRYQPGANVVVPVPAFHILHEVPSFLGYEVRYLHLRPENNFRLNLEELSKLVDDNTKVIVLNSPHNPTGVVYSQTEIQAVLELAQKYNAEILSDEHYRFLPDTSNIDVLPSLYGSSANMVALGSPGKCFGCIGLRIGWLIGSLDVINACHDFKDYTTHTVSPINDFLAKSVLHNYQQILPKYRGWISQNLLQFNDFVEQHSHVIGWVKPDAGTVAFPFLKNSSIKSEFLAQKLVESAGVLVLPGEAFDRPGFFRISFGVNPELFNTALKAFSQVLKSCL